MSCFAKDQVCDERAVYYQVEKAKGGASMLCSGANQVDPIIARLKPSSFEVNVDDRIIPAYRKVADAVHEYEAKFVVQLADSGGATSNRDYPDAPPLLAASPIPGIIYKETPLEIQEEELERKAKLFGEAAARVKLAKCDGIVIHAGHGQLIMGFYSPLFNRRTDKFSGPMENRVRPLFMIIDAVRRNIGRDMALGVRVSGDEFMEGGLTIDDTKAVCILLDKSGLVDWIDVSSGNDGDWLSRGIHYASMYVPLGAMVPLAAAIREVVKVPVMAGGSRINDPIQAEKILADGHADLVGMTRALIADPHLPNKAKAGQLEDIRQCVGAVEACISRCFLGKSISCVQNPVIGREKEWAELKPASVKKKVMVIGGGPAGLEVARVAALRGHMVTLYEKTAELGGQVLIAAKAPTRQEIGSITRWLALQVRKLGVDIHLNTEITPEMVGKGNPDAVVVATGSVPSSLSILGATEQNLMDERSVLLGKGKVGQRVVVLDGTGDTDGCSTAELLATQGKEVYILAKGYQVGENIDVVTKPLVYRSLLEKGVTLIPFTWIRSISDKSVIIYNTFTFKEGKIENIDTVVYAIGATPNDQLYKSLKGKVKELYAIGDCVAARRIQNAIYDGGRLGREL
jgi:2,4-dienoyl-CoA reductase-like NADH-dependent reductase (Old Yellow Enzyme family)/thioredoxin reductase